MWQHHNQRNSVQNFPLPLSIPCLLYIVTNNKIIIQALFVLSHFSNGFFLNALILFVRAFLLFPAVICAMVSELSTISIIPCVRLVSTVIFTTYCHITCANATICLNVKIHLSLHFKHLIHNFEHLQC